MPIVTKIELDETKWVCEVCGERATGCYREVVDITSEPSILGFHAPGDSAPRSAMGREFFRCPKHKPPV